MSLHSVRPTFNDLGEGDEVVIRKGYHENVFKVLTLKGDERRFTHGVTGDGTEIKFEPSGGGDWGRLTGPHGETWTLYYSFPLPEMPEEDRISYARALIGEAASYPYHETNWWEHPVAFLVDRDDDDGVYARIVSHDAGYVTKNEDDVEALSYKRLGVADILADFGKVGDMWLSKEPVKLDRTNLPAGVTAGKILIGTGIDVAITHDTTLTTVHNVAVLPGEFTPETVSAAFPVRPEKARNRAFPSLNRAVKLTPVAHWKHTAEAARHALASDEALVVVFPDPKNPDGNSEHIGILTSRGVVVYLDESFALEEFSRRGGLMPGVVHATGLKPWSHQSTDGEWDGGMDFTEEPADEDSLAHFGLDLAALGALVRGFVDDEEMDEYRAMDDQQLASHMMSLNKPRVSAQSPFSALVKPN
ncbi:hypothetical protein [Rhizobium sp. BK176]|uniref:hypothetical protein n=1 Tax=Rhizobium sp. BK176 TaxID=2587071 RepID=UPI0021679C43|nr:hypothetical protein [Rhizobium sp. BK176]MCS4088594.1 hypothetical protein [Rhizobium sp. BK176]